MGTGAAPGIAPGTGHSADPHRLRKELPFYLGGEECFCTREAGVGDSAGDFGTLDRQAIADAGLEVLYADRPSVIAGHAFSTGRNTCDKRSPS